MLDNEEEEEVKKDIKPYWNGKHKHGAKTDEGASQVIVVVPKPKLKEPSCSPLAPTPSPFLQSISMPWSISHALHCQQMPKTIMISASRVYTLYSVLLKKKIL